MDAHATSQPILLNKQPRTSYVPARQVGEKLIVGSQPPFCCPTINQPRVTPCLLAAGEDRRLPASSTASSTDYSASPASASSPYYPLCGYPGYSQYSNAGSAETTRMRTLSDCFCSCALRFQTAILLVSPKKSNPSFPIPSTCPELVWYRWLASRLFLDRTALSKMVANVACKGSVFAPDEVY